MKTIRCALLLLLIGYALTGCIPPETRACYGQEPSPGDTGGLATAVKPTILPDQPPGTFMPKPLYPYIHTWSNISVSLTQDIPCRLDVYKDGVWIPLDTAQSPPLEAYYRIQVDCVSAGLHATNTAGLYDQLNAGYRDGCWTTYCQYHGEPAWFEMSFQKGFTAQTVLSGNGHVTVSPDTPLGSVASFSWDHPHNVTLTAENGYAIQYVALSYEKDGTEYFQSFYPGLSYQVTTTLREGFPFDTVYHIYYQTVPVSQDEYARLRVAPEANRWALEPFPLRVPLVNPGDPAFIEFNRNDGIEYQIYIEKNGMREAVPPDAAYVPLGDRFTVEVNASSQGCRVLFCNEPDSQIRPAEDWGILSNGFIRFGGTYTDLNRPYIYLSADFVINPWILAETEHCQFSPDPFLVEDRAMYLGQNEIKISADAGYRLQKITVLCLKAGRLWQTVTLLDHAVKSFTLHTTDLPIADEYSINIETESR